MFGRKNPYHYPQRGHYPYPASRSSSGIFFLLIILAAVFFLQYKTNYLPSTETIPFWFLALIIIVIFFLFKRREHYY